MEPANFNFACAALDKVSFVEIANTRPHACSTIVSDHMQGYDVTSGARMRREWGDNGATWGDNGRQELAQTHAEFAQTHANSATPAAIDHLQHMALAEHTCWHQNMHTPRLYCVDDVCLLSLLLLSSDVATEKNFPEVRPSLVSYSIYHRKNIALYMSSRENLNRFPVIFQKSKKPEKK